MSDSEVLILKTVASFRPTETQLAVAWGELLGTHDP